MSRIGKSPIPIPSKVTITLNKNSVVVKGPKGELQRDFPPEINIKQEENEIVLSRNSEHRTHRSKHGLSRSLLYNMVVGVSEGFKKELRIEGVGYRAAVQGRDLVMSLGYSHPVVFQPPKNISFTVDKSGTQLVVEGIDKAVVGEMAAKIRRARPPEPYKGKGVRYANEIISRKAGKAGKAK